MTNATIQDITLYRGDSFRIKGTISKLDPEFCEGSECTVVPFDLTQLNVIANIYTSPTNCAPTANFIVDVIDAENGVIELTLPASISQTLTRDKYYWSTTITDISVDYSVTVFTGSIMVLKKL